MKKIILLFCAFFLAHMTNAAVRLTGTIDKEAGENLMLLSVDKGIPVPCKTATADAAKTFVIEADIPYTGLYLLANDIGVKHPLYLKDGDKLTIRYANDKMTVQGCTTAVGRTLAQWGTAKAPAMVQAYLYASIPGGETVEPTVFNPAYKALQVKAKTLKKQLTGTDSQLAALLIDADLALMKLSYYKNHGGELDSLYVSDVDMKAYTALLNHADLLKLPLAGDLLWMYVNHRAEQAQIGKEDFGARAALLPTSALREAYLFREAQLLRYYEQLAKLQEVMGTQPFCKAFEQGLEPIKAKLAWSKPGQPAIDFEGLCPDGSRLKLSDLRGKLVVVDVWATWCVPCLRMMPLFKQLEEELKNPHLAFMSVCLGVSVEEDRWRKIIADNHLKGNLIFIDSWTKGFAKDYHVTGVPRFLIIGPDGKVISYAAPAPIHPELKQMIMDQLGSHGL
ncbi:MAG: TlpA family protein disulfide reductase [Prevotella sp.]|nr:TlpA family protein disulfide reductase [Prevotella sp.]MDY4039798.1 TlpA disulfide reductase family protein [Prevotella sp.]